MGDFEEKYIEEEEKTYYVTSDITITFTEAVDSYTDDISELGAVAKEQFLERLHSNNVRYDDIMSYEVYEVCDS